MTQRLSRFAWFVLCYNVLVVLWGAYVRATGSGAGCGRHWPLCNGEVVPSFADHGDGDRVLAPRLQRPRARSWSRLLAVWVWRAFQTGHPARRGAALSVVFIVTEAAVGAGLVLFQLVADNATMARAMFMAVHLINTFALLACLTLTAHWVSGRSTRPPRRAWSRSRGCSVRHCVGMVAVGKSGAVAALGDTLYPPSIAQRRA